MTKYRLSNGTVIDIAHHSKDTGWPYIDEIAPIPKSAWDNVNPNPYYSYLCSAMTLTVVYKAHRACEAVPSFDASYFAAHEWRNLSYATDRGIVFG